MRAPHVPDTAAVLFTIRPKAAFLAPSSWPLQTSTACSCRPLSRFARVGNSIIQFMARCTTTIFIIRVVIATKGVMIRIHPTILFIIIVFALLLGFLFFFLLLCLLGFFLIGFFFLSSPSFFWPEDSSEASTRGGKRCAKAPPKDLWKKQFFFETQHHLKKECTV